MSNQQEYYYPNAESGHHHKYLINPLLKMIFSASHSLKNQPKPRLLDIGCGNGSLTNLIAQQGYEVIGVEDSKSGVRLAQEKFTDCRFIQGSIYDLPYTEMGGQFDIIISCEVIEHLFYPKELVRNTKQLLKPNGRLILTTPYHGYLKNLALAISGKMDKHFTALWDGGHIKFFSVVTMKSLLISEGYEDIKFKFAGAIPYLWKSMLCSSTLK